MATYSEYQWLLRQLNETKLLLEENKDSLLMAISLTDRIQSIENELSEMEIKEYYDSSIRLWFGGNAVYGSKGIFVNFASETSALISNMVTSKYIELLQGGTNSATKGKLKGKNQSNMYISNMLHGSFGYEMGWVEDELFSQEYASQAISEIMNLVEVTATDIDKFEEKLHRESIRTLSYLRKFYKVVSNKSSILKMESGMNYWELSADQLSVGNSRISKTNMIEELKSYRGVFKGILIDSGKFEFVNEDGKKYQGNTNEELTEEQLVGFNQKFSNCECTLIINEQSIYLPSAGPKTVLELRNIQELKG